MSSVKRLKKQVCSSNLYLPTLVSTGSRQLAALALAAFAVGCTAIPADPARIDGYRQTADDGPGVKSMVQRGTSELPRNLPKSRIGNPPSYVVFGQRYYVMDSSRGFRERGVASWYGSKFHGRKTSSGETYNMYNLTAAHKHLPLPTFVQVTNLDNGKRLIVKVNDRGPFVDDRIIDLSYAAASQLGVLENGTAPVEIVAISENVEQMASKQVNSKASDTGAISQTAEEAVSAIASPTQAVADAPAVPNSQVSAEPSVPELVPELVPDLAAAKASAATLDLPAPAPDTDSDLLPNANVVVNHGEVSTATSAAAGVSADQQAAIAEAIGTVIQIGAYSSRENAEMMRRRVDEVMQERAALVLSDEQTSLHRVQVGPLPHAAPLDAILARLQLAGIEKVTIFER